VAVPSSGCLRASGNRQEDQGRLLWVIERPLKGREVFQQGGPEPVIRPDPVADQVRATGGEQAQVDADLVRTAHGLQISAHARLVGDDPGVFRVGLAITPVGRCGVMHDPSGDIEQLLSVRGQQLSSPGEWLQCPSAPVPVSSLCLFLFPEMAVMMANVQKKS
jgi:hypothetical protein